jgi:hypothetical protein
VKKWLYANIRRPASCSTPPDGTCLPLRRAGRGIKALSLVLAQCSRRAALSFLLAPCPLLRQTVRAHTQGRARSSAASSC